MCEEKFIPETLKAWAAGAFDGEGCGVILKRYAGRGGLTHDSYQVIVKVVNTKYDFIEPFVSVWGARYRVDKYNKNSKGIHTIDAHIAEFSRDTVIPFITDILPYLRSKKQRMTIILSALQTLIDQIAQNGLRSSSIVLEPFYEELKIVDPLTKGYQASRTHISLEV